ncbi:MAG: cation:proton antiporter [Thermoplasmata archaeon]|nr:cation:proton antiporter [Thermoplasmata archaeon]
MLSDQTEFIVSLVVLLGTSLLAGEIALRLGQAALVGQLLAGILLGPYLLGPFYGLTVATGVSASLTAVQFLATFFLLFLAGMEMGPDDIYGMKLGTFLTGLAVFLVPFGATLVVGFFVLPGTSLLLLLFVAATLSVTALPILAVMLGEFGLVGRPLGRLAMTVALVNELAAVTVFALLLQVYKAGGHPTGPSLAIAIGSITLFLAVVLIAHQVLAILQSRAGWNAFTLKVGTTLRSRQAGFAILMVLAMGAALFSQALGLTFLIGAFYAGILVTPASVGEASYKSVRSILAVVCWGFFIPLFLAITGLQVDLTVFLSIAGLSTLLALFAVAALAKVGAGASATLVQGWSAPDALAFGFMVNSRGAVGIAMAVILLGAGVFSSQLFTVVVAVGIATTILAPLGAVLSWRLTRRSREEMLLRMPQLARRPGASAPLAGPLIDEP